ncbi:hypothetical protein [Arachidicoccus ginsenosidivorans]|uniref:hypothetical protein n=1 Tax=Arachidicoccus ginsenosidivorans TaxID=496057 RepID=UPI001CEF9856|nr:hypothetical protein [Arachidicoccus ginsenosidivorans]
MNTQQKNIKPEVHYSCHFEAKREGEQFVSQHILSYQISGTLKFNDGDKEYIFKKEIFGSPKEIG